MRVTEGATQGEVVVAKLITPCLFTYQEVKARSALEPLRLVFDHFGDEGLAKKGKKGIFLDFFVFI